MSVTHHEISPDEDSMRLDRWVKTHFPDVKFGQMQKLLRSGQIRVDGKRAKANVHVQTGQSVRMPPLPKLEETQSQPEHDGRARRPNPQMLVHLQESILFDDRHLAILNKPHGLAVQGGSGTNNHLELYLKELFPHCEQVRLVHRLDRDTSGALVVAKTRSSARMLGEIFRSRSAQKTYRALVFGAPFPAQGKLDNYIAKRGGRGTEEMRVVHENEHDAQRAVTHFNILEELAQDASLVSLKPVTGRTHQLRVQMADIGHAIIGDPKYAPRDQKRPRGVANSLHLHAMRLQFPHPKTEEPVDVTAAYPNHFAKSLKLLGAKDNLSAS